MDKWKLSLRFYILGIVIGILIGTFATLSFTQMHANSVLDAVSEVFSEY